jgi:hypothetical protein
MSHTVWSINKAVSQKKNACTANAGWFVPNSCSFRIVRLAEYGRFADLDIAWRMTQGRVGK